MDGKEKKQNKKIVEERKVKSSPKLKKLKTVIS